ncbi:MAG: hypothetical protein EA339_02310 [Rhodobacteraceae bacterium]|nr:MAG: hypothetical protein EA339_02310 [Paracoccaceae bacterium]
MRARGRMMLHDQLARSAFWALPDHEGRSSSGRRVGVEVEFAGLSVAQTAAVLRDLWGGNVTHAGAQGVTLDGGRLSRLRVELDISLQEKWLEDLAAASLGDLVPVEIVTAPLLPHALETLAEGLDALVAAGARGTQEKLAFGFGVHFNPDLPDDPAAALAVARAFGLLEDWLRHSAPLDTARRLLPFVKPWPAVLIDLLAAGEATTLKQLAPAYARLAPARGFGLDLLPVLEHLIPDALCGVPETQLKGGRPTYHYRLPETRLGDGDWSLAYEWNRWVVIEHVAADAALLACLAQDWNTHRARLVSLKRDWAAHVEALLCEAGIVARAAQPLASG